MRPGEHNDPADCICRRHAWSIGVPIMGRERWICLECAEIVESLKMVKRAQFDFYERQAVEDAGKHAGEYLDAIDKTDLAQLSAEEFREFISKAVLGFGDSLRNQIRHGAPPF